MADNSSANTTVPYCVDPNWLPYEAIENNQHIGLSSDYIKILESKTGYNFELIQTNSWQQSLAYIQSGQCLLIPMLNKSPERSAFMDFTDVYFYSPNFLVSTQEKPFLQSFESIGNQTLGVTAGYRITEFIQNKYPTINTQKFPSEIAGLKAVANGEIDLFVGSVLSINNHVQALGLTNIKFAGWGGLDDSLRMGVTKGQSTLLAEIQQALNQISKQQHFEIYNKWNDVKVIDHTNYRLVWQIILVGTVVLLLVFWRYRSMRRYNKTLTTKNRQLNELQMKLLQSNSDLKKISTHDALTGLYNRHYFNQLIAENSFKHSHTSPLCLILIDLDYFKTINDNHGHVVGDEVLKVFGQLLKTCAQSDELVCRWGGEEFVILKQPSTLSEAKNLCKKIQLNIKHQTFPHNLILTCSFGVAQINPDENLMACFERADKMLYKAKNQGRNRICISN